LTLSREDQEVIRRGSMIQVSPVETLDHHLPGVTEVLKDADGLFIDAVGIVVLGQSAIVHVGKLAGHLSVIEEVIDEH
jgi:hypothetical protein